MEDNLSIVHSFMPLLERLPPPKTIRESLTLEYIEYTIRCYASTSSDEIHLLEDWYVLVKSVAKLNLFFLFRVCSLPTPTGDPYDRILFLYHFQVVKQTAFRNVSRPPLLWIQIIFLSLLANTQEQDTSHHCMSIRDKRIRFI